METKCKNLRNKTVNEEIKQKNKKEPRVQT